MKLTQHHLSGAEVKSNSHSVPFFQPKLSINIPGDAYEQEADAMADKVMRVPANSLSLGEGRGEAFFKPAVSSIQRKCQHCEKEEKKIHRKESGEATTPSVTPAVEQTLQSTGQPMDKPTCSFMEERFGYDFSNVQIHNDASAHKSSADIKALAYTHQNHVVFGAGQYQPQTNLGKQLLAHELTHVTQQRGVERLMFQNKIYKSGRVLNNVSSRLTVQRAVSSLCNSPMIWFGPTGAPGLGILAEKLIEDDFKTKMGATSVNTYFDNSFAGPIDPFYIAFLLSKNPGIPSWAKLGIAITTLQRPDMLIHSSAFKEFDEIKPNSITGLVAGLLKISTINYYMAKFSLPYSLGTSYIPTPIINIASTTIAGIPIRFFLSVRRYAPGLIVYDLCIETDWALVTKAAAILLLIAIIAAILAGLPIPAPVPV